ncbi:hypothetical protein GGX14DRAFT_396989 [Mycena pura]|uniref:Uncharacterized protein n=1 Tax=Mycena pura TaxID=153505 RepID=A0AAD6V9A4_9AGAR|nr:hypothetical protein GGX14DRAFT_396989 [Mycena pura]
MTVLYEVKSPRCNSKSPLLYSKSPLCDGFQDKRKTVTMAHSTLQTTRVKTSDNEHEDNDDDLQRTRSKRTRQLSEREAQRLADAAEAAECKATKAAKAAEKQHHLETRARPAPVPVRDTVFVSREVGTNQPEKKLVEHSSRVPVSPAQRPLVVANGSRPVPITGTDWRQYVGHPIPEDYEDRAEPRLYDINGKCLPNRVRLDLRTVSQDITQVLEAGPSSAPSRGRLRKRSISPKTGIRAISQCYPIICTSLYWMPGVTGAEYIGDLATKLSEEGQASKRAGRGEQDAVPRRGAGAGGETPAGSTPIPVPLAGDPPPWSAAAAGQPGAAPMEGACRRARVEWVEDGRGGLAARVGRRSPCSLFVASEAPGT